MCTNQASLFSNIPAEYTSYAPTFFLIRFITLQKRKSRFGNTRIKISEVTITCHNSFREHQEKNIYKYVAKKGIALFIYLKNIQ